MSQAQDPPASRAYQSLHQEIVAECEFDLAPEPGMAQGGLSAALSLRLLPGVVRTLLDVLVDFTGTSVDKLLISNRDLIKTVVSQKALEFLDREVANLNKT